MTQPFLVDILLNSMLCYARYQSGWPRVHKESPDNHQKSGASRLDGPGHKPLSQKNVKRSRLATIAS